MKKIAIVMNEITVGGVDVALIEMLHRFDYTRYDVTLWVGYGTGEMQSQIDPRVTVRYWGVSNSGKQLITLLKRGRIIGFCQGILYRLLGRIFRKSEEKSTIYCIRSLPFCTDEIYDCVICYQGVSPVAIANALYRIKGHRRILWVHGDLSRSADLMSFMTKIYHCFDRVLSVSEASLKEFIDKFQYPAIHTVVCRNMVDSEGIIRKSSAPFEVALNRPTIVTVGRLSPEKGQTMVPAAMRILLDAGYDSYWYLIGDGSSREKIQDEITKNKVSDHLFLLGTQMNPYPYIKACDIYVQPSFSEGYCTTTVEARVLQKPIVTTDAPGMREQFLSGENGLIVDAMTPEALAEGIRTLLDHPELRQKFVDNLKKETFDNSKELCKLYDFIEN